MKTKLLLVFIFYALVFLIGFQNSVFAVSDSTPQITNFIIDSNLAANYRWANGMFITAQGFGDPVKGLGYFDVLINKIDAVVVTSYSYNLSASDPADSFFIAENLAPMMSAMLRKGANDLTLVHDGDGSGKGVTISFTMVTLNGTANLSSGTDLQLQSVNYTNKVFSSVPFIVQDGITDSNGFVFFKGKNFDQKQTYEILFNGNYVKNVTSENDGTLQGAFGLTPDMNFTTYHFNYTPIGFKVTDPVQGINLLSIGDGNETVAIALISVSADADILRLRPILELVPDHGRYGDVIGIYGMGLGANESYPITLGSSFDYQKLTGETDENGNFIVNATIHPPGINNFIHYLESVFGFNEGNRIFNDTIETKSIGPVISIRTGLNQGIGEGFEIVNS